MASGGNLSNSQQNASESLLEFVCTPCEKAGRNSEAEYQCIECQSSFCTKCVDLHNQILSFHTLLNKTAMQTTQLNVPGRRASTANDIPCTEHPGKLIEMYCGQHDEVCCTVCIAVKHRSCRGVEFIPNVAKGIGTGYARQKASSSLEEVRQKMQDCLSKSEEVLSGVDKEHEGCIRDIAALKARLINRINELEQKSIELANARQKQMTDCVNTDITSLKDMLEVIDDEIDKVNNVSNTNETELFIRLNQSKLQISKCSNLLDTLTFKTDNFMTYGLNNEIESVLNKTESLISVVEDDTIDAETAYAATLLDTFSVKVESDKDNSFIYGLCTLDDQILLTDYHNDKVKRFDSTFVIIDYLAMVGNPYGMCKTDDSEVAVGLCGLNKVQFVSVGDTLSETRSFNVGARCRGMCYSQACLYVCCSEGGWNNDSVGQVKVFDRSGNLLNIIQNDYCGKALFSSPQGVYVNQNTSQIYTIDSMKGATSIDTSNYHAFPITDLDITNPTSITADDLGNMFISGCESNNVIQIDRNGKFLGTLLTQTDGIKSPSCVLYLANPSRLIVCEDWSERIKIFKLN